MLVNGVISWVVAASVLGPYSSSLTLVMFWCLECGWYSS